MWVYRLGAEKAKAMLLTGDVITGKQAADWGLILESVDEAYLDRRVEDLADRIAGVPINQLIMQKLMINQAYYNMGFKTTQILATLFDGIARHSPEGRWFQKLAEEKGFKEAIKWRDSGKWIPEGGIKDEPSQGD
jgi:enoyl-CoA hydratase